MTATSARWIVSRLQCENSSGCVQVCVLSLKPEPTVVCCNGVCNARILSIVSVPNLPTGPGAGAGAGQGAASWAGDWAEWGGGWATPDSSSNLEWGKHKYKPGNHQSTITL